MKTFLVIIALSCIFSEIRATGTASSVAWTSPAVTVSGNKYQEYTNGYVLTFSKAGVIISDNVDVTASGTTDGPIVYVTPTLTTGSSGTAPVVGWGMVTTASSTCDATALAAVKKLTTIKGTGQSTTCPGDMVSDYTGTARPASTTSPVLAANLVPSGTSASFQVLQPASATCYTAVVGPVGTTATLGAGTCGTPSSSDASGNFKVNSANKYAFYVEFIGSDGSASVCVQTASQYTATTVDGKTASGAGNCGTSKASGASIVSAFMAPIVLAVLMIFA